MPIPKVIRPPDSAKYLKQGFDQLAELLALTLGPTQGGVVSHSNVKERPEMLNDAATIARRFVALPDRRQDVGAMMVRQLAWRVHKQVGDGCATSAVLAQAILQETTRVVTAGANVVRVQQGVEKATARASRALSELAEPVGGQEDLAAVAQAVTGEAKLAWVLGEMFDLLGPQAYITVENYVAPYLERVYYEGGRWSGQLVSPYLITAPTTGRAIQRECTVVLYAGHLQRAELLEPVLELAGRQEPPHLLLVAPEISGEAVKLLVTAHQNPKNKLKISAVALKIGGEQGLSELNDLALLTGATVLGEVAGRPLPSLTAQDLGWAGRIEADKKELFVVNGRGDRRAIRERITAWQGRLNTLLADAPEREALRRRLTRLSGSAGILKIGAHTKPERAVLRQKAEQGIKVLAATLVEGVVPGGGVAYIRAATRLEPHGVADPDERLGWLAVKQALSAPFFRILQNGHVPAPAVILNRLLAAGPDQVYDVVQGKLTSAREAGILDAAQIARRVLESAASGALMALSVDVTVLKRRPVTNVDYEP